ncbi:MAG TPA: Rieske 2Fe-2S domain-containing protein [Verrucomicrobiae bacterium]|nr:Rieske 2Fe-2S domain-containing protein [Verrucomicrobiae bacterium]
MLGEAEIGPREAGKQAGTSSAQGIAGSEFVADCSHEEHGASSLMRRRRFCALASGCFLGAACGASRALALGDKPVDIGPIAAYTKNQVSEKFVGHDFLVVRHKNRLFAVIAVCPHQGNPLFADPHNPNQILCLTHTAIFTAEGMPVRGPVSKGLPHLGISANKVGHAIVDPTIEFPPHQWTDKAGYIAL